MDQRLLSEPMIKPAGFDLMLTWSGRQLILFGGKGGVGKTTSAAAASLFLARLHPERKILIVSTDPAHSLGDSFHLPIGREMVPVDGLANLWAQELDASESLARFKSTHGEIMKLLTERGTFLDSGDIDDFFSLSLPGMDEVMAIIEIANLLRERRFHQIILDTAPVGHTLRLLSLPKHMEKWVEVMALMQTKHRYMKTKIAGRYRKDTADDFLEMMASDIRRVKRLLADSSGTEFVPVTTPDPMSILETERLVGSLVHHQIPVRSIIVNRIAENRDCPFCMSRTHDQEASLRAISEKFGDYTLLEIPLGPRQIQGMEQLTQFGKLLLGEVRSGGSEPQPVPEQEKADLFPKKNLNGILQSTPEFLIFGGKGGVGKTSVAAAVAVYMARKWPEKQILVFSTNPAHSLSDSFGQQIDDRLTPIRMGRGSFQAGENNLFAIEMDATRLFDDLKGEFKGCVEELFEKFLKGGLDLKFDKQVMSELFSLSPPGLDEIMALKEIVEFQSGGKFDHIILDTAPTGHLLRFLRMPQVARDWLNTFYRMFLKYKDVVRMGRIIDRLLELSRGVKQIRAILTDKEKTEFVAVTLPEAMAATETRRLLSGLAGFGVPCSHIVVNMMIPPVPCTFCTGKRREQEEYLRKDVWAGFPGISLSQVPLFPREIIGVEALADLGDFLFSSNPIHETMETN